MNEQYYGLTGDGIGYAFAILAICLLPAVPFGFYETYKFDKENKIGFFQVIKAMFTGGEIP